MIPLLDFLRRFKYDCFIFVDFNTNTLKKDSEQRQYNNFLQAHGFCVQNYVPTRVTPITSTFLDNVITRLPIETKTSEITIGDQFAQIASIPSKSGAREHQVKKPEVIPESQNYKNR